MFTGETVSIKEVVNQVKVISWNWFIAKQGNSQTGVPAQLVVWDCSEKSIQGYAHCWRSCEGEVHQIQWRIFNKLIGGAKIIEENIRVDDYKLLNLQY